MVGLLIEITGWLAAGATVATYAMRTMFPLRVMAIVSSVFFIGYAIPTQAWPVLAMEVFLLPLNVWRLMQLLSLRTRVEDMRRTKTEDFSVLEAYSKGRTYPAGATIFNRGDDGDALYYIASGSVRIEEAGALLTEGQIFGEIAFFTDEAVRTATARVETEAVIHRVDERTFLRLQFQDPSFGMAVMRTITRRLRDGVGSTAPTHAMEVPGLDGRADGP